MKINYTRAIAASLTRHVLTAGGVAGVATSHDDVVRFISVLVTLGGLVWSIIEKLNRPPGSS
jgi:hypothetical protein